MRQSGEVWAKSAPYLACTPCVPLFCTLFNRGGNRRVFRLRGVGGDHLYCTVEPSPGHTRCQVVAEKFVPSLESLSSLGFEERKIWDVPGILSGCPGPLGVFKKFVQTKFLRIFRSLISKAQHPSRGSLQSGVSQERKSGREVEG